MTFLEFCEMYNGHPLSNWQKEYALEMEKRINELKARGKSSEDITIKMPRGNVKASPLYHWFLYEYVNKEECDMTREEEPTTKNNLGVGKTDMIDKSNFSQEQYKADLQSAYDCGKSVIDKIRAEIKAMSGDIETIADVLAIIDKYKSESEDKE